MLFRILNLKFVICLLFVICNLCFTASAVEVPSKITVLAVSGNSEVPAQEILGAVFSKVGEGVDDGKIKNDLKAIYALGYFEDVDVSFEPYQDGTRVIYEVAENPILSSIELSGNTVYSSNDVIKTLGLAPGKVFNFKTLRSGIESVNKKYKQSGYTLARIVDVSRDEDKISIKVVEGIVESVSLEGNEVTRPYVILREMDTKVGQVFNEEILAKDLRRIFNLGFFSEISPAFEPGSSNDKIVLTLKMKETRSNTVNFGGGWGEREGWFGFLDLSINNLIGTAQGLLIRGQSGQQLATYQFKYTNPWFLPDKLGKRTSYTLKLWNTLGTDIYLTQQDQVNVGWDMAFGKTYKDNYGASLSFGTESISPRSSASFEAYTAPYVGVSLSYDTRDFWMNPKKGVYHLLSFKQGWKFTAVQTSFFKIGLDLNGFRPVTENLVFAGHAGVGLGLDDVPLGELYWAGGPNTVRGYGLDELRRGYRKVLTNLELRLTFNEVFQGVLFFDWGNAWNAGPPHISDFIAGWGPGLRMNTPLGPIRLDYGMSTSRSFGDGILHFSIGQAF